MSLSVMLSHLEGVIGWMIFDDLILAYHLSM